MPQVNPYNVAQPVIPGTRLDYEHFHDDPLYQAARQQIIYRSITSRMLGIAAVASLALGIIGFGAVVGTSTIMGGLLLAAGVAGAVMMGYKSWQHRLDAQFAPTDARSRLRSQNLAQSFQPILQQGQGMQNFPQNQRADGQAWTAVVGNDVAQSGQSQSR